jgi:hypothetical protein
MMKKTGIALAAVTATVMAVAALFAFATARPASALPSYTQTCSNCHSSTPVGSVTATPSTTTPAPGAAYTVDIGISLSASGNTGYRIVGANAGTANPGVSGGPSSNASYTAHMTAPAAAGTYDYKVYGVKTPTNTISNGQTGIATFSITVSSAPVADTTAPTTVAAGAAAGGWYNLAKVVTLTATDNAGGSGIASITYAVDGGAPVTVPGGTTQVTVPDSGTANGPHTLTYHATDIATNVESQRSLTVNLDTVGPATQGLAAASVTKGKTATLKYQVNDAAPSAGNAKVVIKVKTGAGKVVKTLNLGSRPVNAAQSAKFKCLLAKGKYKFFVYATDAAGNVQTTIGSNKLTVK